MVNSEYHLSINDGRELVELVEKNFANNLAFTLDVLTKPLQLYDIVEKRYFFKCQQDLLPL